MLNKKKNIVHEQSESRGENVLIETSEISNKTVKRKRKLTAKVLDSQDPNIININFPKSKYKNNQKIQKQKKSKQCDSIHEIPPKKRKLAANYDSINSNATSNKKLCSKIEKQIKKK